MSIKDHQHRNRIKWIEKILKEPVVVQRLFNETNTHIRIKYDKFWKEWGVFKPGDFKVSHIDRTLMKFYDKVFDLLPKIENGNVPTSYVFGFSYLHKSETLYLSYILDSKGDKVKEVFDFSTIKSYSELLGTKSPITEFSGELTDRQKIELQKFSSMLRFSEVDVEKQFGTSSITEFVLNLLKIDRNGEDFIFKFPDSNFNIKASYLELEFEKDIEEPVSKNFYWTLILDFMHFITSEMDIEKIKPVGATYEERYVYFISELFARFYPGFKEDRSIMKIEVPNFLKYRSFRLNKKFISNSSLLKLLADDKDHYVEKSFKMILNAFSKERKQTNEHFSKSSLTLFNLTVNKIKNHIQKGLADNRLNEDIKTYSQLINDNKLYWLADFRFFTNDILSIAENVKSSLGNDLVLVIDHKRLNDFQLEMLFEALNEFSYIQNLVTVEELDESCNVLTTKQVCEKINIETEKINESVKDIDSFSSFSNAFPKKLHKFYEKFKEGQKRNKRGR